MSQTAVIVGIRFPSSGKTYSFGAAEGMELRVGDRVVVESELGISIGTVVKPNLTEGLDAEGLRPVLRKVTAADIKQEEENEEAKREALIFCNERIAARGLDMKLITADVTLDRKRFIFYFVSETRIDFRELVKDLASKLRARIELRQIGVRDAAKLIGGFGICGKEVCCKTWLKSFAPISIKMAKQQDLVLNTCKLSGLCGRLMCCLNYEYDEDALRNKRRKRPQDSSEQTAQAPEQAEQAQETAAETAAREPAEIERAEPEAVSAGPMREQPEQPEPEQRRPEQKRPEYKRYEQRERRAYRPERPERTEAAGATAPAVAGEAGGQPAQAPQEGSPFKKRRRKKRKGSGPSGQPHLAQQQAQPAQGQEPSAQAHAQGPGQRTEQSAEGENISRSKRRRMRRNRHKKPQGGEPQGGQPQGNSGPSDSSGSPSHGGE